MSINSHAYIFSYFLFFIFLILQKELTAGTGLRGPVSVHLKQQQDEEVEREKEVVYLGGVGLQHCHQSDGANNP